MSSDNIDESIKYINKLDFERTYWNNFRKYCHRSSPEEYDDHLKQSNTRI